MERFTVDRIEGDFAVLEGEGGSMSDVPLSGLPEGVEEGDCLALDGGLWSIDERGRSERRDRIAGKMAKLFKR